MKERGIILKYTCFLICTVFFSCDLNETDHNEKSFLFVEVLSHYSSQIIREDSICLNMQVDFPMYTYDSVNNKLNIQHSFKIDKTTNILLGRGTFLSGPAGGGGASRISNIPYNEYIDSLYWAFSDSLDVVKLSFRDDTFMEVDIDTLSFFLKPNESKIIENKYTYQQDSIYCTFEITRKLSFINHGIIPLTNIKVINQ